MYDGKFFHFSRRTTVVQDLYVRQFSLVQDNHTNVNVEACTIMHSSHFYILTMGTCFKPMGKLIIDVI
jgi:hypothetical protein